MSLSLFDSIKAAWGPEWKIFEIEDGIKEASPYVHKILSHYYHTVNLRDGIMTEDLNENSEAVTVLDYWKTKVKKVFETEPGKENVGVLYIENHCNAKRYFFLYDNRWEHGYDRPAQIAWELKEGARIFEDFETKKRKRELERLERERQREQEREEEKRRIDERKAWEKEERIIALQLAAESATRLDFEAKHRVAEEARKRLAEEEEQKLAEEARIRLAEEEEQKLAEEARRRLAEEQKLAEEERYEKEKADKLWKAKFRQARHTEARFNHRIDVRKINRDAPRSSSHLSTSCPPRSSSHLSTSCPGFLETSCADNSSSYISSWIIVPAVVAVGCCVYRKFQHQPEMTNRELDDLYLREWEEKLELIGREL